MLIFQHFRPVRQKIPLITDDSLRRLTMPVLTIIGGRDVIFDARHTARRLARTAPHATIVFLPHARHILPDQTTPVLEFLLSSNPQQPVPPNTDPQPRSAPIALSTSSAVE
jgi:pimeloyl-ACP methyl ester carboxylesterase